MAADEEDGKRVSARVKPDRGDPLEDRTQPMSTEPDSEGPEFEERSAAFDTTTWGGSSSPPVIVEAELEDSADDTLVLPSESESESASDGGVGDPDSMATVVTMGPPSTVAKAPLAPSSSLRPMLLERIQPSLGRGERVRLDALHWRMSLGRAEHSDLRLYTASASREHASITGDEAGNWVLTPAEGKSVSIDGDVVSQPIVLEVGMNIVLGGDHLRCVTEGLEPGQMNARTGADGFDEPGKTPAGRPHGLSLGWWAIALCALTGIGLILYSVFGG